MENFIENKLTHSKKVIAKILNYYSFIKSNINEKEQINKIIENLDKDQTNNYKGSDVAFSSKGIDLLKSNIQLIFKLYDWKNWYFS